MQADGYYGLGTAYLQQGDLAQAISYFKKMKALPGGAAWHPRILDADYALALAAERSGQPADLAAAKQTYANIMAKANQAGIELLAKATLGTAESWRRRATRSRRPRRGRSSLRSIIISRSTRFTGPPCRS